MAGGEDFEARVGVLGLGFGAQIVLKNLENMPGIGRMIAGADVEESARKLFQEQFPSLKCYDSAEALCEDDDVSVIWVATPNGLHAKHAEMAANNGKHVIGEKPMATNVAECTAIAEAVERNGVYFVQGHTKINQSILRGFRSVVASGEFGRVIQIDTMNFNDWLFRALTEDEVDTEAGTGPIFRQAPHQIDIVRFLAGSKAVRVRASSGRWAPGYPRADANYIALIEFDDGICASLSFNGYGYWNTAEITWQIGEGGFLGEDFEGIAKGYRHNEPISREEKNAALARGDRSGRGSPEVEGTTHALDQSFFGLTVVSCERGVVRQSPSGIYAYGENGRQEARFHTIQPRGVVELMELRDAIAQKRNPFPDASWGRATVEICEAIVASAKSQRDVELQCQTSVPSWLQAEEISWFTT